MKTRLNLKPGQKGTRTLVATYGDRLVCVRYRYDYDTRKRYKTAEIIIDETDWQPPPRLFPDDALVPLTIAAHETDLQSRAKKAGGRWDPRGQVWYVPYGKIAWTKLEGRIALDAKKKRQSECEGI